MKQNQEYILIVDDDPLVLRALERELASWAEERSLVILKAASAEEGLGVVEERASAIRVILSDLFMPGMLGSDFLAKVGREHPEIVTLLITSQPNLEEIVKSARANLFGLLRKPWDRWNLRVELSMANDLASSRRVGFKPQRVESGALGGPEGN